MFESPVSNNKENRNFASPPGKKIIFLNLFDWYEKIDIYVWKSYL